MCAAVRVVFAVVAAESQVAHAPTSSRTLTVTPSHYRNSAFAPHSNPGPLRCNSPTAPFYLRPTSYAARVGLLRCDDCKYYSTASRFPRSQGTPAIKSRLNKGLLSWVLGSKQRPRIPSDHTNPMLLCCPPNRRNEKRQVLWGGYGYRRLRWDTPTTEIHLVTSNTTPDSSWARTGRLRLHSPRARHV